MHPPAQFKRLFDSLGRAKDAPPADLTVALAALPEVGQLPSPWLTWTLIVFALMRDFQHWAKTVLWDLVLDELPQMDELSGEDLPMDGLSEEGLPMEVSVGWWEQWKYQLATDYKFVYFMHAVTDQTIVLDLLHPDTDAFVSLPKFPVRHGTVEPGSPEERLRQLLPSSAAIELSVESLVSAGIMEAADVHEAFIAHRLTAAALEHAEELADFGESWADAAGPERVWLAGLVGDWSAAAAAAEASGDHELIALTRGRLESCRAERSSLTMVRLTDNGSNDITPANALREAGQEELREDVRDPNWGAKVAMGIFDGKDDPDYWPEVRSLLDWVRSGGEGRGPTLAARCAAFLARHGQDPATLIALIQEALPHSGEPTLLAMEHMPDRALPVIRRDLRPPTGGAGATITAILSIINRPWSRAELMLVLKETASPEETKFVRAALRESGNSAARQAVEAWEEFYLDDCAEVASALPGDRGSTIRRLRIEDNQIRHRVEPFRGRMPGPAPVAAAGRTGRPHRGGPPSGERPEGRGGSGRAG